MADASTPARAGPVAAGWQALGAARWTDARARFHEALVADESPEALEGLSWAAWWLDDADAVFSARAGAYRPYRARGAPAAAARMAIWLAVDQLDFRGAWSVASAWLRSSRTF